MVVFMAKLPDRDYQHFILNKDAEVLRGEDAGQFNAILERAFQTLSDRGYDVIPELSEMVSPGIPASFLVGRERRAAVPDPLIKRAVYELIESLPYRSGAFFSTF